MYILRYLFVFISFTASSGFASEKFIGLVEIPQLFGTVDPEGPPGQTPPKKIVPLKLYKEPSKKSQITQKVSKTEDILTAEYGYEETLVKVYNLKNNWYFIKTKFGNGWLSPDQAGKFRLYDEMFELPTPGYLTKSWNKKIYKLPQVNSQSQELSLAELNREDWESKRFTVQIIQQKKVKEQLWFEIQFIKGHCSGKKVEKGKKGWVPAVDLRTAEPNVWHFSRGC